MGATDRWGKKRLHVRLVLPFVHGQLQSANMLALQWFIPSAQRALPSLLISRNFIMSSSSH